MLGTGSISGWKTTRDPVEMSFLFKAKQSAFSVSYMQLPEPDEKQ